MPAPGRLNFNQANPTPFSSRLLSFPCAQPGLLGSRGQESARFQGFRKLGPLLSSAHPSRRPQCGPQLVRIHFGDGIFLAFSMGSVNRSKMRDILSSFTFSHSLRCSCLPKLQHTWTAFISVGLGCGPPVNSLLRYTVFCFPLLKDEYMIQICPLPSERLLACFQHCHAGQ